MKGTYVKTVHVRQATVCKTMGPIERGDVGDAGQKGEGVASDMAVNNTKIKADRGRMYGWEGL